MNKENSNYNVIQDGKILLGLLPFWDPLNPPLGLTYIKSYLNQYGYKIKTFDLNVENEFKEIYENYFETMKEYIPKNKRSNFYNIGTDVLINCMMTHIHYEDEGEYIELIKILFLKLLRDEFPGHQKVYSVRDINRGIGDLSSVTIPDSSDLNLESYSEMGAYGSRSCPFKCKFCSETIRWGQFRKKSGRQVVQELTELYKKYGYQLYLLADSLLNPIVTDLAEVFLKSDISIYWDGYLRVDKHACNSETVLLGRKGGFYMARFSVERGSQHILDLMDKKITPGQIKEAVINLALAGIKTTTYWLIGFPGETEEDFQQTHDIVRELTNFIYQTEKNPYWYYLDGQVSSAEWAEKSYLVYPEKARHLLRLQKRDLDCESSKKEKYRRLARFTEHIEKLNLLNPYSLQDIIKADEHWMKLHKNAVPPLGEFKDNGKYIGENKRLKKQSLVKVYLRMMMTGNFKIE